jgi:phenylacetate-coenzyme A ligase PaaK-like adenylate-forming protein
MEAAWGTKSFDVYACTEASGVAMECEAHAGLHVMEGMVILEVEPDGRVLLTNLHNRVQPLIRYEMTDLLRLVEEPCPCGRSSKRIAAIEGRDDDVIRLPDAAGREVPVHPNHFCEAVESIAGVHAYQVREEDRGIEIDVVAPDRDRDEVAAAIWARVDGHLEALGVTGTPIHVRTVAAIRRPDGASGKFKLVSGRSARRRSGAATG